jgi:hypothetical protein
VHGPTGAAAAFEAQRLLMDMVAGSVGRKSTGATLSHIYILGLNSHWELVSIKTTFKATGL